MADGVGGNRNCVYIDVQLTDVVRNLYGWNPWQVVDLETGRLMDGKLLVPATTSEYDCYQYPLCWIVPSLDNVSSATIRDETAL